MKKTVLKRLQADELYLLTAKAERAGAYYWLKAEGQGEQLESALMRLEYGNLVAAIEALGGERPSAAAMYRAAQMIWPAAKLHAGPKAEVGR